MIRVHDVSKSYGSVRVLSRVSFHAEAGKVLLLLGDNGAGKTTLVRSILGITDYQGSIRVGELDPLTEGKAVRGKIGYMPQNGGLHLDLSVGETLSFYSAVRDVPEERGFERLTAVELDRFAESAVGELSIGMRQRLGFAVATLSCPPVLLLDEPTASLDARSRDLLAEGVRGLANEGTTVLLSTHAESHLAEISDFSLRLEEGRLVA